MATDETADKDRRAYKVPIPGNKSVVVTYGYPLLLGVTQMADGYNFAVEAEEDSEVYLLLYRKRGKISYRTDFFCLYEKIKCNQSGIQF